MNHTFSFICHDSKRGTARGVDGRRGREMGEGGEGIGKSNRGGEFNQSTLYTCMEISQ
jgi:hypothetical protein